MVTGTISDRLGAVRETISQACERVGRESNQVQLIGVTKTRSVSVCEAAHNLGILDLGENYVQEWSEKADALDHLSPPIRWHAIGTLQSNKVRSLVGRTALIHTVDRKKLMTALQNRGQQIGQTVSFLLQVNVAGEEQKGGCTPEDCLLLAKHAYELPHLSLRGLMTVAPLSSDPESTRPVFRELRLLLERLRDDAPTAQKSELTELSMGMSGDLAVAVEEGATWVRVGSALFGPRP